MARPRLETLLTRRRFVTAAGSTLAAVTFGPACLVATKSKEDGDARLSARPRTGITTTVSSGPLGLGDSRRDGVIQMPSSRRSGKVPLLVFLHGATQIGAGVLRRIGPAADQAGIAILAPDSRGTTWDAIRADFSDDV